MHDLKLVMSFAFHTVVAVLLFLLIGGAVTLLNYAVETLAEIGMPPFIPEAVKATEYFLFAVDLICFVVYVTREAFTLIKAILGYGDAVAEPPQHPRLPPPSESQPAPITGSPR